MSSYAVIDSSKHDSVNWDDVLEEEGYEKWSLDGSKFIVEFESEIPEWANGETILNREQTRIIVKEEF